MHRKRTQCRRVVHLPRNNCSSKFKLFKCFKLKVFLKINGPLSYLLLWLRVQVVPIPQLQHLSRIGAKPIIVGEMTRHVTVLATVIHMACGLHLAAIDVLDPVHLLATIDVVMLVPVVVAIALHMVPTDVVVMIALVVEVILTVNEAQTAIKGVTVQMGEIKRSRRRGQRTLFGIIHCHLIILKVYIQDIILTGLVTDTGTVLSRTLFVGGVT